MKVNFSGVKASKGFAPIIGWREVTVIEGEARITQEGKNAGNTYVNWTLLVTDVEDNNRRIWHITSLSDGGLPQLLGFLEAVGFDASDGFDSDTDIEKIINTKLMALCAEDDRGKTKVSAVKELQGAQGEASLLP